MVNTPKQMLVETVEKAWQAAKAVLRGVVRVRVVGIEFRHRPGMGSSGEVQENEDRNRQVER